MEAVIVLLALGGCGFFARHFYAGVTAALPQDLPFKLPIQLTLWALFDVGVLMVVTTGQYYPAPGRDWLVLLPSLSIAIPILIFYRVGKAQGNTESWAFLTAAIILTSVISNAGGEAERSTQSLFLVIAPLILLLTRSHQLRTVKFPAITAKLPWWCSAGAALLLLAPMAGYFNENGLLSEGGGYLAASHITSIVVVVLVAAKAWYLRSHFLTNVTGDSGDAIRLNSILIEMALYGVLVSGSIFALINLIFPGTYFLGAAASQYGPLLLVVLLAMNIHHSPLRLGTAAVVVLAALLL